MILFFIIILVFHSPTAFQKFVLAGFAAVDMSPIIVLAHLAIRNPHMKTQKVWNFIPLTSRYW
jgi:hypothetical protein